MPNDEETKLTNRMERLGKYKVALFSEQFPMSRDEYFHSALEGGKHLEWLIKKVMKLAKDLTIHRGHEGSNRYLSKYYIFVWKVVNGYSEKFKERLMKISLAKMLNIFKTEIDRLINRFSPVKSFQLLENDEKGKLITYSLEEKQFLCKSEEDYFEIKYNEKRLIKDYFKLPIFTKEELEDLFRYFARHEYGHTILLKVDNLFERTRFKTESHQRFCYTLLGSFKELYADWFVNHYFEPPPHYYLERWSIDLNVNREIFKDRNFLERIPVYLHRNLYMAERFLIFDCWNLLQDFYINNDLGLFYNHLFEILSRLQENCNVDIEYDVLRENLLRLGEQLDKLDYTQILNIQ